MDQVHWYGPGPLVWTNREGGRWHTWCTLYSCSGGDHIVKFFLKGVFVFKKGVITALGTNKDDMYHIVVSSSCAIIIRE